MVKIALDAGHGLYTPGKRTPDDEREWSFNNKVLLACVAELNKYHNVSILRLDDHTGQRDVPLSERTNKANRWGADVLVSIHHNANTSKWGSWGGVETFVYRTNNGKAHQLANIINPKIVKAMGLRNRGVKSANLHMVRETRMPAILTEGGFMDSTTDIRALRDSNKLKAQGIAIAQGLAEYYKLQRKKEDIVVNESKPTYTEAGPSHKEAWEWGYKRGITDGRDPNEPITRAQLMTMLYRYEHPDKRLKNK